MRIPTAVFSLVTIVPLVLASSGFAYAQSAGTSGTGMSNGTPGQPSPSNPEGGMSKSGMSSPSGSAATGAGENKPTATGGQAGGAAGKN